MVVPQQRPADNQPPSLAQERLRRPNRRLPLRFRDTLPENLPSLPPPEIFSKPKIASKDDTNVPSSSSQATPSASLKQFLYTSVRKSLRTQINKFGLFRVYNTDSPPRHDPEDPYSVENVHSAHIDSEPSGSRASNTVENPYHPYPDESSMRLGDWYWNLGAQKSKETFRQLLDIIGDPAFRPSVVLETAWDTIDSQLGHNHFDGDVPEWLEEDVGWKCSSLSISVPFHSHSKNPGPKNYVVDGFYHRPLLSIIKEKITNPAHASHFHLEPYELQWHPPHRDHDVRVYGELFTSAAFLDANQTLQDAPPEPGCDLPRVVAALMFWSDSTHLTAFGDVKLWPLYVYFGNDSKYRRCQPTLGLCSHAAYFQVVCLLRLPLKLVSFSSLATG